MALVKISELPATVTVLDTQEIPTNNAGVNEKIIVGQIRNGSVYSITASYNMSLTDGYTRIHFNHSATTKLIEVNLPNVASSVGRAILFQNIGISGLSYINGNGANIILGDNTLTAVKLLMLGDKIILRSNGTVWATESVHISMKTNGINRGDWNTETIGSSFLYDTKSAAVDLTGQHITNIDDGGSLQKAIALYDSGGAGNSGTMFVYNITDSATSKGIWPNNQTCQCGSGGYTFEINEVGGSSKNNDCNIYHGLGLNFGAIFTFILKIYAGTTYQEANTAQMHFGGFDRGNQNGACLVNIDTNNFQILTTNAVDWMNAAGLIVPLAAQDYSFSQEWAINI
jgi:hypothetical protein